MHHSNRDLLFKTELAAAKQFQLRFPDDRALVSIMNQLHYLIDLEAGIRTDAERLSEIIVGILAVREIEAIDADLAYLLYEVDSEAKKMKAERNDF